MCVLPNGELDNKVTDREYLNNVINRINELINEKNNDLKSRLETLNTKRYDELNIQFRNVRAILSSLEMVNMFIRANNTTFMKCSAFESGIIPQKFYKQTKSTRQ